MNSRKSSASSTSSSHGVSKLKPVQPTTSASLNTHSPSNSTSSIKKSQTNNENSKRTKSYLEGFTEEDIQNDKVKQRYELLMNKLESLTTEPKVLKNNSASASPLPSSKKVLPKIQKIKETDESKPKSSILDHTKTSQLNSIENNSKHSNENSSLSSKKVASNVQKSSDDESDDENVAPVNPIKAPNELLEEVSN